LYFPFLIFNKLHLHPWVLPWILPEGHKEFGSLLITDCTDIINTPFILFIYFFTGRNLIPLDDFI
jgi:hypothetical protein